MSNKPASNIKHKKNYYGVLTVALLSIGSTIGAGIYFKTSELLNNTGNIWLVYLAWTIAVIGFIAFGCCLGSLNHYNTSKDLGILGWIKSLNNKKIFAGSHRFLMWVYIPLSTTFMSYYVVMSFQDALACFGLAENSLNTIEVILIAFAIMIYFTVTSSSLKVANIQNAIITFFKFIPILIIVIGGIILFGKANSNNEVAQDWANYQPDTGGVSPFTRLIPIFGVISCLPAIMFTFDGFYIPTHTFNEMRKPNKGPLAICIGIIIIAAIYILIVTGIWFGTVGESGYYTDMHFPNALIGVLSILIGIGVMGIINGFVILGADTYRKTYKKAIGFHIAANKKSLIYFMVILFTFGFLIFTTAGVFYFSNGGNSVYGTWGNLGGTAGLYNLADLIGNWTSTFMFGFFILPLYSMLKKHWNKLSKKLRTAAIIAIAYLAISFAYMSIETFFNLFYYLINGNSYEKISQILETSAYIIIMVVCLGNYICKKKRLNQTNN